MQKPLGDGTTLRQQYEAVERITGKRPTELIAPPMPAAAVHVWRWFSDLHSCRQNGFGANPISFGDMHSYFMLRSERPSQWEVTLLRRLDDVALRVMASTNKPT